MVKNTGSGGGAAAAGEGRTGGAEPGGMQFVRPGGLLTKALAREIPPLYSQENVDDPIVRAHFFNPGGSGDWWVTEGSAEGDDFVMFGFADIGMGPGNSELGYVSLNELESVRNPMGLSIERDKYWTPVPLSKATEGR